MKTFTVTTKRKEWRVYEVEETFEIEAETEEEAEKKALSGSVSSETQTESCVDTDSDSETEVTDTEDTTAYEYCSACGHEIEPGEACNRKDCPGSIH